MMLEGNRGHHLFWCELVNETVAEHFVISKPTNEGLINGLSPN